MPFLADFIKKWVHFIKNSDVTSLVIDQSQLKCTEQSDTKLYENMYVYSLELLSAHCRF